MSDSELGQMGVSALSQCYRKGDASPLDATRAALERIEHYNDAVNAYTYVDADGAEDAAKASARRWGQGKPLGPLDGIPVSLKDLTDVAGMPTSNGSLLSSNKPCTTDAPPAQRLREAGAVLLGKTNTPEDGWKAVTDNLVVGASRNPWDTRLTTGGSSGGAAAAAALNMGVLHQGGDSGGSIRIPAAFCGVFGFKPTFGWTPQWPPAEEPTLSHIGPITRSVEDAVAMLNVIGRYDYIDPYATRGQPEDWGQDLDQGVEGLRIAFSPTLGFADVDPQVATRVREAADRLADLGAEVIEIDPEITSPLWIFQRLWFTASLEMVSQLSEADRTKLDPGLYENAMRAEDWHAIDLFRAQSARAKLTMHLERFNQHYHLLMTPSVPIEPFEANHQVPPGSDMRDWEEWAPFSYPFNLSQQPAASVPCGFTDSGLPVGFQLAGGKFDDIRVLRASHAYLKAHPPRFPLLPDPTRTGG